MIKLPMLISESTFQKMFTLDIQKHFNGFLVLTKNFAFLPQTQKERFFAVGVVGVVPLPACFSTANWSNFRLKGKKRKRFLWNKKTQTESLESLLREILVWLDFQRFPIDRLASFKEITTIDISYSWLHIHVL